MRIKLIDNNKFMNLFPLINRPKKPHSFANPLNGLMFYNGQIDTKRQQEPQISTISYNSTLEIENKLGNLSTIKTKSHKKMKSFKFNDSLEKIEMTPIRSSKLIKSYYVNSQIDKTQEREVSVLASNRSDKYTFPEVQITPLHLINKFQDIAKFRIHINLQKYFTMYFSNGFKSNHRKLNQLLQKYIPLLKNLGILDKQIDKKMWPKEFWEIKSIEQFLKTCDKYEKPSDYWKKYILTLMMIYCIPHEDLRRSALENVSLLIHKQINYLFKIPEPNEQFYFSLENGTIVQDFLDIPFSTSKLFFTAKSPRGQITQKYQKYLQIVRQRNQQIKKKGFIGRLRNHFRKEIVPNKYDQDTINYDVDYSSKDKERKVSLHKAMAILQKKNQNKSKMNLVHITPLASVRTKSDEQLWKQENIEDSQVHEIKQMQYPFHLYINNKKIEKYIISEFNKYHQLSKNVSESINSNEIYISILQKYHPIMSQLFSNQFHTYRVKSIFEFIISSKLPDDREKSKSTINWREFVDLSILTSKNLQKLIQQDDCYQLVKNFAQAYLEMNDEDYFRDQLTSKLYHMIEGDGKTLGLMEEVLWSWLSENGFLRLGAIQRDLLWTYEQRSKLFYLLIISMIFGTFKTTPLDLAYQLLV